MAINKVWIDESENECTMCGACEAICDAVFEVPEKAIIVEKPDYSLEAEILEARECCPTQVIKIQRN